MTGFTLIELILVLVIMATTLALVSPSLHGWNRGAELRDAGDHFMATVRYARTQAIATSQTYRLTVDSRSGTYQLTVLQGTDYVPLGNELGRQLSVPEGTKIDLSGLDGKAMEYMEFYPSGRTDPARIKIWNEQTKDEIQIECPAPAAEFRFVTDPSR